MRLTGLPRLALAGGVVSNVKATRRIRLLPEVEDVYVFPHMGDGGLARRAQRSWPRPDRRAPVVRSTSTDLDLGPAYDDDAIADGLRDAGLAAERAADLAGARRATCSPRASIVMWFQGGMEYGPRALGHRSVLARPDRPACAIG